ncbi:MAG: hypothetical protein GY754_38875 [bacterium]|nr:hypothetical protein [bacterium]
MATNSSDKNTHEPQNIPEQDTKIQVEETVPESTEPKKGADKLKETLEIKKKQVMTFVDHVYHGETGDSKILNKLANTIKVFVVAARKFLIDDCISKASAIAYTVIVSLIPTLSVGVIMYSLFQKADQKQDVFATIRNLAAEYNLNIDLDPILNTLTALIENAGKIGGIGAIVMIISATALIRVLEKSLNDIWKVKKNRPIFLRIVYYWAALTLGPVMLVAGPAAAGMVSEFFSSPSYNSIQVMGPQGGITVGTKTTINNITLKNTSIKLSSMNVIGNIDFDNQRNYIFDNEKDKVFKEIDDTGFDDITIQQIQFSDIQFIGKSGWITGSTGAILSTENGGKNWSLKKWGDFNLVDIHMLDKKRGFIIPKPDSFLSGPQKGMVLSTTNGGETWKVKIWKDVSSNFYSIAFHKDKGIITGRKGQILWTTDRGETWKLKKLEEAKRKTSYVNLNKAYFVDSKTIWITGSSGIILVSKDGGESWGIRKFKEFNYTALHFFSKSEGIVATDKGMMIQTLDGGERWNSIKSALTKNQINQLIFSEKKLWAVGNSGTIMVSPDRGKSWVKHEGTSFIAYLINFLAPFIFIWVLFLLVYISLPNTKVPFKYASIGAAFTGTVWVIFLLLFMYYAKYMSGGKLAIYGALASIPLFLLLIYSSSLIILFGAEVSYTVMHPESYKSLKKAFADNRQMNLFYGIAILHHIYGKFERGEGSTHFPELSQTVSHNVDQVDFYTQLFVEREFIKKDDENGYIPANSSQNIKLVDIIEIIYEIGFDIPVGKRSPFKATVRELFGKITDSRKKLIGEITLKELIEKK